jgi:transcriptional regulator with XRE-family HTH domain
MDIINNLCNLTSNSIDYKFMRMKTTLSERLKSAMSLHGNKMSQATLAKLSGISQPSINRLVTGKVDGSSYLVQIAKALDVDPDWLATGRGEMLKGEIRPMSEKLEGLNSVSVWDKDGITNETVICPIAKPTATWRAYILDKNSGCRDATAGSVIFIDTAISPGTNDYVIAKVSEEVSVYTFLSGGLKGFLSVDDARIPLIDLSTSGELIGVVQFILRDMRR